MKPTDTPTPYGSMPPRMLAGATLSPSRELAAAIERALAGLPGPLVALGRRLAYSEGISALHGARELLDAAEALRVAEARAERELHLSPEASALPEAI